MMIRAGLVLLLLSSAVGAAEPPKSEARAILNEALPEVPGTRITVTRLHYEPKAPGLTAPHTHPGPVFVQVIEGTMRLGIHGQAVQTVHAGESFYEPAGAIHTVAENASETEPATALAIQLLPEGKPGLSPATLPGK